MCTTHGERSQTPTLKNCHPASQSGRHPWQGCDFDFERRHVLSTEQRTWIAQEGPHEGIYSFTSGFGSRAHPIQVVHLNNMQAHESFHSLDDFVWRGPGGDKKTGAIETGVIRRSYSLFSDCPNVSNPRRCASNTASPREWTASLP